MSDTKQTLGRHCGLFWMVEASRAQCPASELELHVHMDVVHNRGGRTCLGSLKSWQLFQVVSLKVL